MRVAMWVVLMRWRCIRRALSAGEVLEHFEAVGDQAAYGSLVAGDGPLSYWRLDEAAGPVAVDVMAANYGTFKGTPALWRAGCCGAIVAAGIVGREW